MSGAAPHAGANAGFDAFRPSGLIEERNVLLPRQTHHHQ